MEETQQPLTVAYCLQNAPLVYWGELVGLDDKKDDRTIYLAKPMVMLIHRGEHDNTSIKWSKPIACGNSSLLALDPETVPGVCVYHPDEEQAQAYRSEYTQAHSKLTLLR